MLQPRAANIGQGRAVQLDGPRHLSNVAPLVAIALSRIGPLKRFLALRLQRAVIHPLVDVAALKGLVDVIGPGRAPVHQQLLGVPVAVLGTEPLGANLASGQHDMRMMVPLIPFTPRGVQGDVSDHPAGDELRLNEPAHQIAVLFWRQLGGQGHAHLAADLRILASLDSLDGVPQRRAIPRPVRGMLRGEDFGVKDAILAGVVVHLAGARITHTLGGAVRARGGRGPPLTSGNHPAERGGFEHSTEAKMQFWLTVRISCNCDPPPQRSTSTLWHVVARPASLSVQRSENFVAIAHQTACSWANWCARSGSLSA